MREKEPARWVVLCEHLLAQDVTSQDLSPSSDKQSEWQNGVSQWSGDIYSVQHRKVRLSSRVCALLQHSLLLDLFVWCQHEDKNLSYLFENLLITLFSNHHDAAASNGNVLPAPERQKAQAVWLYLYAYYKHDYRCIMCIVILTSRLISVGTVSLEERQGRLCLWLCQLSLHLCRNPPVARRFIWRKSALNKIKVNIFFRCTV